MHDPVVAERLTPRDHPFAAKRPPIDTTYFETLNRGNVTLVDLRNTPSSRSSAPVSAPAIDAQYSPDGEADPIFYLGLQIPGFPNLFTITGPGSPSVLTNMPTAIEQHVDCISHMWETGATRIETSATKAELGASRPAGL